MKSPPSDIVRRSFKGVSQPSPLSFSYYFCDRFFCKLEEFLITYCLRIPNPKNTSKTFVYGGMESFLICLSQALVSES